MKTSGTASASRRVTFLTALMLLGWTILAGRLIHLQAHQRRILHSHADRQSTYTEVLRARPGEILDRNGHVLAMSVTRNSVYAVPSRIDDAREFAWKAASVTGVDAAELLHRLRAAKNRHFLWICRRVSDDVARKFRDLNLPPRTWGFRQEYLRQYPQGSVAAHVLGIRDIDNRGHGGLEEFFDDRLRGRDGQRVLTRDARGVVVEVESAASITPVHGRSVVCTIDLLTQIALERQLEHIMDRWTPVGGACGIVMDPRSGDILAMASRPDFDPNTPADAADHAWTNLTISAMFEPGSTFKPLIVGWALDQGVLNRSDMIRCFSGAYRMGSRILRDHHAFHLLSVEDVLVRSSNIGMARIAERLGLDGLYNGTIAFGFGRRTGIELPGELTGLVRDRRHWNLYSLGSVPMGQEIAVTPLQLITAHAVLAGDGRLMRPHLLLPDTERMGTASATEPPPRSAAAQVESTVLRPQTAAWLVRHPMKQVVERGTGTAARIPGLSVFGKTGTAQKIDPETGTYSDSRHICSFLCGAPAENPEVLVLIVVDEPTAPGGHYGGTVAAPAAARVLQNALERSRRLRRTRTIRPEDDLPVRLQ